MEDGKELIPNGKYTPALTAAVKAQTVSEVVQAKLDLLKKVPERTQLSDAEAVRRVAEIYMQHCADYSLIPSFQGLAAQLGVSRVALYKFIQVHPDTPSVVYLERLRALYTDCRISATDRGATSEALSIFLLKNSGENYADRVEIQPVEPVKPYDSINSEELAKKYLADMVEDSE